MTYRKQYMFFAAKSVAIIYCVAMFFLAVDALKKPAYNWDMLPYMAVILLYDNADAKIVHNEIYTIAKDQIPAVFYNRMVDPANAYRNNVAQNAEAFRSQLPFYLVKPLYTRAAWLFYKAGIVLPLATVLPSAIAYFFIGILLFFWLKKYWNIFQACIGGLLIMLSPPLLSIAALSSPDALSALLIFLAVFLLTETKSFMLTLALLLLAVFARLDNILPAVGIGLIIFFGKNWYPVMSVKKKGLFIVMFLLSFFMISGSVRSFGWSIFFYPTFAKQLNTSYTTSSAFNFSAYISLAKSQLMTGLYFSFICIFFFLVFLLLRNSNIFKLNSLTMEQIVTVLFILIIMLRFILQPLIADRLYVPYYLSIILFLVKKYSLAASQQ